MKNRIMAAVAAGAFALGLMIPLVAKANDYGDYQTCLRHCAGSCTFSGTCYLKEK